ncbi:MAG: InlB B-repeat-containing protein [Acidimicrobiales bacterium]
MTCTTIGATCAISGLTNGMPYEFTVVADNKAGGSSISKSSNVVTPKVPTTIPTPPPSNPVAPSTPTTTTTTIPAPSGGGGGGGGGTAPSSYVVTFNANGSGGSMPSETSSSAAALTTNVLTRTGYTFSGWNTAANGSGTAYADGANYGFGASVTLYAQWSADFFAVTFNANGGSGSMTAQSENSMTALSANSFAYAGYIFSGWNTQANGSGTSYGDGSSYSFSAALALYAQWTAVSVVANTYTVSFNANGGAGSMSPESSNTGASLSANAFGRSGYTFSGWNTQANGSGTGYADRASYGFGANVTLYAQWAVDVFTVTFNANGGTGSMAGESSSSTRALSVDTFSDSGFTFSGWNTQASGGGTAYAGGANYGFGANVTLYAQWSANFFAVTFNANGGSGSMTTQSENTTTALIANSFTHSGFTFSGWNTQANGGGTAYAGGANYGFGANVTLYAQWAAASVPVVTLSPTSQVVGNGNTATFSASASGNPAPSVQWEVSSNGGSSWSVINGATSASYSLTSTPFVNGYEYEAVFTNSDGTATSAVAQLTVPTVSNNWAGYVDTGGTFSAVSAKWVVPKVTCSGTGTLLAVQWVGIDGAGSSTVEQDGTMTSCDGSTPGYSAWYEMYGDASVNNGYMVGLSTSQYHVSPGNSMTASVSLTGDQWTLKIVDTTAGWTFSTVITSSAPAAVSAEVITENPGVCTGSCSEGSLADFGLVTYTNISVTSSTTGTGSITSSTVMAVECNDSSNVTMMSPGILSGGGTSFTDTWIASS